MRTDLANPNEYIQDSVALDLSSRLAWKTIDLRGAAQALQALSPKNRSIVASKMVRIGTDAPIANAALIMSFTPLKGFGQTPSDSTPSQPDQSLQSLQAYWTSPTWVVIRTVSMAASAYHGYRRNQSIGWALWWGLMGSVFPILVPTIAIAEGFGKPKK